MDRHENLRSAQREKSDSGWAEENHNRCQPPLLRCRVEFIDLGLAERWGLSIVRGDGSPLQHNLISFRSSGMESLLVAGAETMMGANFAVQLAETFDVTACFFATPRTLPLCRTIACRPDDE